MGTSEQATSEMRAMARLLLRSRDAEAAGFGLTDYATALRELDASTHGRSPEVEQPESPLWPPAPRLFLPQARG